MHVATGVDGYARFWMSVRRGVPSRPDRAVEGAPQVVP